MAAVTEILYINTDGAAGVRGTPTSIGASDTVDAKGIWSFSGGPTAFTGNVSITGNLDVAGDIISRSQVNLVIQDSFLDLGFGNTTTTAASGGFTVQMNRTSTFTAGNVTSFDSSSTFTYTDAGSSTLLVAGDIIAITNMPTNLASNEGFFVVASVSGAAFPQTVTIATSPTASVPFAQTAFVAASFPAAVSPSGLAFQCDIAVLAVADGTTDFKNGAGVAFAKGTFVQAYIPDATVSAFQANGAYNVIGGTTLQQAYDSSSNPATILTAAAKPLRFSLNATGPFQVQGPGAVEIGTGGGLTDVSSFDVQATGAVALNSTGGALGFGDVSGTGSISIGTLGNRAAITVGSNYITTATVKGQTANFLSYNTSGSATTNLKSQAIGNTGAVNILAQSYDPNGNGNLSIQTAGTYGYIKIGTTNVNHSISIGTAGARSAITIGSTAALAATVEADTIDIGNDAQAHTVNIATSAFAQAVSIGSANTTSSLVLKSGSGDITADATAGSISLDAQDDSNFTVTAAAKSLTLEVAGGGAQQLSLASAGTSVAYTSGSGAISLVASAGSITADAVGPISLDSTSTLANLTLTANDANIAQLYIQATNSGLGNAYVHVWADNSVNIQTLSNGGVINIGSTALAHTIYLGTDGSAQQSVIIGSNYADSYAQVAGGTAVGLRIDSVSGAGIPVVANTNLAAGQVVSLAAGVTPSSTASPAVTKADAKAASPYERRFAGIVQSGGILSGNPGYATSVPGTVTWVAWTTNAGGIPAAGDEGKPVFIESSAVDAAGVATLLAPSSSGEAVQQIGFLASDTASGGLYAVLLAPQFIGQIP